MFERFTDKGRRAIVLAQEEAMRLQHDHIGAEHLLLGLLHEEMGIPHDLLAIRGFSLERGRQFVEDAVGRGATRVQGHVPFTPEAKAALERALREAIDLNHASVATGHLLLGVLDVAPELAMKLIASCGWTPEVLRLDVITALAVETPEAEPGTWDEERRLGKIIRRLSPKASPDGDVDAAVDAPHCASCHKPLTANLRSRPVEADGAKARLFWCGSCGTTAGILPA